MQLQDTDMPPKYNRREEYWAHRNIPKVENPWRLSRREYDIVKKTAEGLTGWEIAERDCLSEKTVSTVLTRAIRKLEAKTKAHAAAIFAVWLDQQDA